MHERDVWKGEFMKEAYRENKEQLLKRLNTRETGLTEEERSNQEKNTG